MPYGALAELDDDAAIAEIASGTLSKTIAERHGVTPYAVRKRLAQHPDYQQAIRDQAHSLVEQATELAMSCSDEDVAIARVRIDAAHKWAAARDSATWGAKQQITQTVTVTIEQTLSADARALLQHVRGRVIEHGEAQDVVADDLMQPQQDDPFLSITKDDSVK